MQIEAGCLLPFWPVALQGRMVGVALSFRYHVTVMGRHSPGDGPQEVSARPEGISLLLVL